VTSRWAHHKIWTKRSCLVLQRHAFECQNDTWDCHDCDTNRSTACFFLLADSTNPKEHLNSFMMTNWSQFNIQDGGCPLFYQYLSMNLQLATSSLHLIKHNVTKKRRIVEVQLHAFLLSAPLDTGHFITGRKALGACKCLGAHDVWRGEFNPEPSAA